MTPHDLKEAFKNTLTRSNIQRTAVLLMVALGVILVLKVTDFAKRQARESLILQAVVLANAINEQAVDQLSGNPEDVSLPAYSAVVNHMKRVKEALPDTRFVYLLKMVNQQVIFIADSEPSGSKDASAYGEVYTEASPALRNVFVDGKSLFEGPLEDRWGTWVSVHAAIKDQAGNVIAIVGIDKRADQWLRLMRIYQFSAMVLTLLLLGLLLLSIFYFLGMSHWQAAEKQVRQKSIEDSLTGLPNRLHITAILNHTLQRAKRNGKCFGVMFLDLNGLKVINDELGHAAGDALICEISNRVKQMLRASDQIGRLGGDEFVVIIEEITSREDALHVAQKIQQKISEPLVLQELRGLVASASVGVALYPDDGEDIDALLSYADEQMYEEKKQRYSVVGNGRRLSDDPEHVDFVDSEQAGSDSALQVNTDIDLPLKKPRRKKATAPALQEPPPSA